MRKDFFSKTSSLLTALALFFTGCSSIQSLSNKGYQDSTGITLTETDLQKSYAYQIYQNQLQDESSKIRYLINTVRFSDETFVRNGEAFLGDKAARWYEFKLYKFPEEAKTAREFIENLASYSKNTKRPYEIIFPEGKTYLIKGVLLNELDKLETYVASEDKRVLDVLEPIDPETPINGADRLLKTSSETLLAPIPSFSPKPNYTAYQQNAKDQPA